MVKSYGRKRAGGYVVVACEIILSTPGTGGTHPHPHSQSQSLDNNTIGYYIMQSDPLGKL